MGRLAASYNNTYTEIMRTTSYSNFRKNLASLLDQVNDDHEPVIITRDSGKPGAVLMSIEDFASYEETRYLLRNPGNAARLMEAMDELDRGGGEIHALIE